MTIRRLMHGMLVLVMMSLLAACNKSGSQTLMRIGPKSITEDQFISYMQFNQPTMQQMQTQGMNQEAIREQMFEQLLLEEVAIYEASLNGAGIDTNDNVKAYQLLGQASGTNDKMTYTDMDAFAKSVRFESADDLRQFLNRLNTLDSYAKTVKTGRAPFVNFRLIKWTITPTDTAEMIETSRIEAESVLQQLKDGESFADLAMQYSDDQATAQMGGEIGGFADIDRVKTILGDEVGAMIADLPLNTPSAVTRAADGWFIFEVTDRGSFVAADQSGNNQFWGAMLQDPSGLMYLQTRIEEYRANGTIQTFKENLATVPMELNPTQSK